MTDIRWPEDLPKQPPEGAFGMTIVDPAVRNQPDRGPPMVRKRASIEFEQWSASYILSKAQWQTLKDFWKITCAYGTAEFETYRWDTLEDIAVVQWAGPPTLEHIARNYVRVEINLIRMPE